MPAVDEHGVRLAGDARAEEALVEPGDPRRDEAGTDRRGRATAPDALHPRPALEPLEAPDRQLLQVDHVRLVGGRELDHAAQEACPTRRWAFPWKTFHVRTSSRMREPRLRVPSAACADARRPRRSPRLHAPVRPRARGSARPGRRGRRARHVAVPLRRAPRRRRVRAGGVLLSALEPDRRPVAAGAEGRRAPGRDAAADAPPRRRDPPAVAGGSGGRRGAAADPDAARLHRARPSPAPYCATHPAVAAPVRSLRPRRRPLRARARRAGGVRRAIRPAAGDPAPRLPERPPPRRRRAHGPLARA